MVSLTIRSVRKLVSFGTCLFVALSVSLPAFAAKAGHDAHHAEGGSGGLPQLDPTTFSSQLFWLLIIFTTLYVVFQFWILPNISKTIDNRHLLIEDERKTAEKLTNEAEEVHALYEQKLKEGREEANRNYRNAADTIKENEDKALASFKDKADKKIEKLYADIEKHKAKAKDDVNVIAAEIAREAAKKIVGVAVDMDQAKSLVKSVEDKAKAA